MVRHLPDAEPVYFVQKYGEWLLVHTLSLAKRSRHCEMQGQRLVAVQLLEWPWADVAKECKEYLGLAPYSLYATMVLINR